MQGAAPMCEFCKIPMEWFNTNSHRLGDSRVLIHSFYCKSCHNIEQTTTSKLETPHEGRASTPQTNAAPLPRR